LAPRLLLVDDSPDDLELALWALGKVGLTDVRAATNGPEALELIRQGSPDAGGPPWRPEWVLLDLRLPGMDGLEVLRELRRDPGAGAPRVVVLTSSEDPRERQACWELGAVAILDKPLDGSVLQERMRSFREAGEN
jgi:CheY-like chemotaxis protein